MSETLSDLSMAKMMADVERGLTVAQRDGDRSLAPSGEAYVTFGLQVAAGARFDNYTHDLKIELIAALGGVLAAYKHDRHGKYLRWRVRPTIEDHIEFLTIRCRVLISASIEAIYEIEREEVTGSGTPLPPNNAEPPKVTWVPIPEICRPVFMLPWVRGYLGASGKFYDEFGKALEQSPQTWRPNP